MIRTVADFMITPFRTVDGLAGLLQIKELFLANNQECFPVMDNEQVVGVLSWKDLLESHPNRIAVDAMSDQFIYVEPDMPFWQAKEILEQNNLSALLIRERNILVGLVTPAVIEHELGRHTDLLTNLYKTDYLYYHALQLLESGQETSIIFTDINNFGLINKQNGHMKGDLILKEFSALLQKHMPPESCLCRFGGDEFVILMAASRKAVAAVSQKMKQIVASYTFPYNIPVTMAAGIATTNRSNDCTLSHSSLLVSLINMASLASTAAKNNRDSKCLEQEDANESA
jgi:diguanylate cyclase (GGDEF)-like protein